MKTKVLPLFTLLLMLAPSQASANVDASDPLFSAGSSCDYLIIVPSDRECITALEPLRLFKQQTGLRTRIVDVDSIRANVNGIDTPEKIRNLITHAWKQWGTRWVLLAGDYERVPGRKLFISKSLYSSDTETVYSDLYFSCLEGNWNYDKDSLYGEDYLSDTLRQLVCAPRCDSTIKIVTGPDLRPDIYIGRMPASTAGELRIMVEKTLSYSTRASSDPQAYDIFFFGAGVDTRGPTIKDATDLLHNRIRPALLNTSSAFRNAAIDELYEDSITPSGIAIRDSIEVTKQQLSSFLSRGYNIVSIVTHGIPQGYGMCSFAQRPYFLLADANTLKSASCSNFLTLSCSTMRMFTPGSTCIAKELMINGNGGAVTYYGSSGKQYMVQDPDRLLYVFRNLAQIGMTKIGKALTLSGKGLYYQSLYVNQFWGDPSLDVWSKRMNASDTFAITITHPGSRYAVSVVPPLDSVLIAITDSADLCIRGYTDSGEVRFDTAVSSPFITVTASKHDYLPSHIGMETGQISIRRTALSGKQVLPGVFFRRKGNDLRIGYEGAVPIWIGLYTIDGRLIYNTRFEHAATQSVPLLPGYIITRIRNNKNELYSIPLVNSGMYRLK